MKPLILEIQAFGPFAGAETIDFSKLGENPLFLINGPTGAGKSSILDAICFALYGETTGKERDPAMMRSDHASLNTPTKVCLDFILRDKTYRVIRFPAQEAPKSKGSGTTSQAPKAQLWFMDGSKEGNLLGNKITDVTKKVEELIGLGVDQFRQVIVLPQGKFRDLLMADSKTRETIFGQLFQTQIYKKIEDKLKEKTDEIKKQIHTNQDTIQGVLKTVELESMDRIGEEMEELAPELEKASLVGEKAFQEWNESRIELEKAKKIKEKFDLLKIKQSELETLQSQETSIHQKKSQLFHAQKAETIRHSYESLVQTEQRLNSVVQIINLCKNELEDSKNHVAISEENLEKVKESSVLLDGWNKELHDLELQLKYIQELNSIQREYQLQEKNVLQQEQELESKKKQLEAWKLEIEGIKKENLDLSSLPELYREKEYELKVFSDTLTQRKKLETLRTEIAKLGVEEKSLNSLLESKVKEESQFQIQLWKSEKNWHLNRAAALARELKEKEPCPVCGSTEHPAPAIFSEEEEVSTEDLDRLREMHTKLITEVQKLKLNQESMQSNVNRITKEAEELGASLLETANQTMDFLINLQKEKQTELSILKLKVEKYKENLYFLTQREAKQIALTGEWEKLREDLLELKQALNQSSAKRDQILKYIPEENRSLGIIQNKIKKTNDSILSLKEQLQSAEEDFKNKSSLFDKLTARADELTRQKQEDQERFLEHSKNWETALLQSEFLKTETFKMYLIGMVAQEKLRLEIEKFTSLRDTLQGAVVHIQEELKNQISPDLQSLEEKVVQKNKVYLERKEEAQKKQERWNLLKNVDSKLNSLQADQKKLNERYGIYGGLSIVATGQSEEKINLQRFVLSVLLEDVLIQASHRLSLMSRGRYALVRKEDRNKGNSASGLDLEVQDEYTGITRDVATLSGGESFLAALSLALGLSDVVQSYSGGIKLDTLFIDEGFGSLDPESLDLAIHTLMELQATGRTIGIISHVSELKEQMALQIEVKSTKKGSTIFTRKGFLN
jgi:DNA repair protein SbcC/Rad50